jgi:hypothetical protein
MKRASSAKSLSALANLQKCCYKQEERVVGLALVGNEYYCV